MVRTRPLTVTVAVAWSFRPASRAVIVVVPTASAVMLPLADTKATDGCDDEYSSAGRVTPQFAAATVAGMLTDSPTRSCALGGLIVTPEMVQAGPEESLQAARARTVATRCRAGWRIGDVVVVSQRRSRSTNPAIPSGDRASKHGPMLSLISPLPLPMTSSSSPSRVTLPSLQGAAFVGDTRRELPSTFTVRDPWDASTVGNVADCGEAEAREAADHAVASFARWCRTTPWERSAVLRRWFDSILAHEEELATLMAREMGKPVTEARGEVKYAAGFVEYYAEEAKRIHGETIPSQFAHKRLHTNLKPVGPVYAFTPWNFPAAMVTRKVAPALAAGCTVILKPAEATPLSALRLADLWQKAGGPPGTFQVLPCLDPVPVSHVLINDPRIRKLTFTGSTEVGMRLYGQAATTMKRLSLELGGHAPFIVCADADIDAAVAQVAASKFRNAGQTCVCANRVYVHSDVHDAFVARFLLAVEGLRVGDPLDPATQIGPLVNDEALEKVVSHVADARAGGAQVLTGGASSGGSFYAPTVLTGVRGGMKILEEETFGPVAPILTFTDEAEVIRAANNVPVGLAAYLWTRDLGRAYRMSEALEYGIIGINDGVPATPQAPFGGVKNSGLGREGGHWGLHEFLDVQYVSTVIG